MKRRSMRTLTLREAHERTGLTIDLLRRAAVAGEIHAFRDTTAPGKGRGGRIHLLEASLEEWFFARVTGHGQAPTEVVPEPRPAALDIDAQLIADTPRADRFV